MLLGRWPPPLQLPAEAQAWSDVPHGFLCPITHSIMAQPALLVSPQLAEAAPTYELSAIRTWLRGNRWVPGAGSNVSLVVLVLFAGTRKATGWLVRVDDYRCNGPSAVPGGTGV